MRRVPPVAVYLAIAVFFTWPAVLHPIAAVPGAPRTDLWDSLWSLWYFAERVMAGQVPLRVDGLLNHPHGGALWVADPINAVLALPLLPVLGVPATWTMLILGHMVFAGMMAHRLGEEVSGSGWVTGVCYASAPILLAHVHNGASEVVGTGFLALSALTTWRLRSGGSVLAAGLALGLCTVSSWYFGVGAFLLLLALSPWRAMFGAGTLAVALAGPVAALAHHAATQKDNVVGIKNDREVATVRRTIGSADPVGYLMPGDYRSPDFRELSRYGEEYIHCHYLGWVTLLAAALALRRRGGTAGWWLAAGIAGALACGPVLTRAGAPVILPGRLAIPLPYLLLDGLPGFSSLSLLWRLAQVPALCLAVLAGRGVAARFALPVCLAMIAETRFVSPMAGLPDTTDARMSAPIVALAAEPDGAVMNFPVAGGRAFLYEQTVHHKPLTGGLNFPNNLASRRVWKAILDHPDAASVTDAARADGIRYLVVHLDPMVRPDMHDTAVRSLKGLFTPIAEGEGVRVYRFW